MSKLFPKKKVKISEIKEKTPSAKKKDWPRILGTILLIFGLTAIWVYFAAMITGHGGISGPWDLLSHKIQGQYAVLFTAMVISIFLLGVKMGIISWAPARKMVIIASIFMAIHIIGLSIWQEDWAPRKWLRSIGEDKPAQAYIRPTAKDYEIYRPGDVFKFKALKGTYSNHWIRPEWETSYKFQSEYGDYEIHYRDGRKFKKGQKRPRTINEDFKIYLVTDCDMRVVFF